MTRDEIVRRFEALLDSSLAAEEPPRGVDADVLDMAQNDATAGEAERQCDSYALWSAMTALTQEVKLQGRTFRELNDCVLSQAGRIGDELRAVYRERERDIEREAERRVRKDILGALIDMRDSLWRGRESASSAHGRAAANDASAGWLKSLLRKNRSTNPEAAVAAALLQGYELSLERLDHLLETLDACEISCQGQPFDPHRMNAVDLDESGAFPDGTVLEIYRSGYEWNGEVFRPAQVKVARAAPKPETPKGAAPNE